MDRKVTGLSSINYRIGLIAVQFVEFVVDDCCLLTRLQGLFDFMFACDRSRLFGLPTLIAIKYKGCTYDYLYNSILDRMESVLSLILLFVLFLFFHNPDCIDPRDLNTKKIKNRCGMSRGTNRCGK